MIEQRLLRTDLDGVKAALARRSRPALIDDVEHAARLDARLLDISRERDDIRAQVNALSKQVGGLRRDGKVDEAETLQATSRELGSTEKRLSEEQDEVSSALDELLLGIPNLPHADAPDGASDDDNPIITGPIALNATFPDWQRVPHWETAEQLGILDNERAV